MFYTSSEAAKLLKRLNEEHDRLRRDETAASVFTAAIGEDIESVRPEYDYKAVQESISDCERKIRKVKHAINEFNINTFVEEAGMTVDQILVYLPQLTMRKNKLNSMQARLPKVRKGVSGNFIDYAYANYDIEAVKADYIKTCDELVKVQSALDKINNSELIELDDDLIL